MWMYVFILIILIGLAWLVARSCLELKEATTRTEKDLRIIKRKSDENIINVNDIRLKKTYVRTYNSMPSTQFIYDHYSRDETFTDYKFRIVTTRTILPYKSTTEQDEKFKDNILFNSDRFFRDTQTWDTDENNFQILASHLQTICVLTITPISKFYLNAEFLQHIDDIITITRAKFESIPLKHFTFPWGDNWYQFSISWPYSLATSYYLLTNIYRRASDLLERFKDYVIYYIDKYVEEADTSMGWVRNGPNVVLIGAGYVAGHWLMGDLYDPSIQNSPSYLELLHQLQIPLVTSGEGRYPDGGFVFHGNVRAYGYISSSQDQATFIGAAQPNDFDIVVQLLSDIMCHPTIAANFSPLFTRTPQQGRFLNPGKLGSFVQNSSRVVSVKYKRSFMQFMGMVPNLAYYESDRLQYMWPSMWVFWRPLFLPNNLRIITTKNVNYLPGVIVKTGFENNVWEIHSSTSTTESFVDPLLSSTSLKYEDDTIFFQNIVCFEQVKGTNCPLKDKQGIMEFKIISEESIQCIYIWDLNQGSDLMINLETGVLLEEKDGVFIFEGKSLFYSGPYTKATISSSIKRDNGTIDIVEETCIRALMNDQQNRLVYTPEDGSKFYYLYYYLLPRIQTTYDTNIEINYSYNTIIFTTPKYFCTSTQPGSRRASFNAFESIFITKNMNGELLTEDLQLEGKFGFSDAGWYEENSFLALPQTQLQRGLYYTIDHSKILAKMTPGTTDVFVAFNCKIRANKFEVPVVIKALPEFYGQNIPVEGKVFIYQFKPTPQVHLIGSRLPLNYLANYKNNVQDWISNTIVYDNLQFPEYQEGYDSDDDGTKELTYIQLPDPAKKINLKEPEAVLTPSD